ncbi:MAG: hypothetical protein N4A33_01545 [Bacteriovoracaceae bacterium]|jgi:hypothetical protein|nr:hypothetical protein [Bacteriovoracaceae bacterium]
MYRIVLLLLSFNAFCIGFMEIDTLEDRKNFNPKGSKWVLEFGVDYLNYPISLAAFKGQYKNFEASEELNFYNIHLGIGREFYLGKGWSFSVKGGGFYADGQDEELGNGASDIDYIISTTKEKNKMYGTQVSGAINFLFENKSVHIQPFIEFTAGTINTNYQKHYIDKGITSITSGVPSLPAQNYHADVEEKGTFTRLALGVNFISNYHISSYFKVSQNNVSISDRTSEFSSSESIVNPTAKDSLSFLGASLGIGYLF